MSTVDPANPTRTAGAIARTTITQICAGFPIYLIGALAVYVQEDIALGPAVLGAIGPVFLGARAASGLWMGRFADRIPGWAGIALSLVATTACCAGIALFATNLPTLMGFLVIGGLGQALAQPAVNRYLAEMVPTGQLGRALAIKQSGPPLTALMAGAGVGIAATFGSWRAVFAGAAVLCAAIGIWVLQAAPLRLRTIAPSFHSWRDWLQRLRWRDDPADVPKAASGRGSIMAMALAMGLAYAGTTSSSLFYVTASVDSGMAPTTAGGYLMIASLTAIAVRLGSGFWVDRKDRDALLAVRWLLAFGAVGYLLLAVGRPVTALIGVMLAFGGGWGYQSLLYHWVARNRSEQVGRATGVIVFGGSVGGIIGPFLFGIIAETLSYALAWSTTALWLALGSFGIAAFAKRARSEA